MKKLILKLLILCAIVSAIAIPISVIIDPQNVFHTQNIRNNGIDPNQNFVKMSYILKNPNKFESYIFGSSRVGAIHVEKMKKEKCYNMTYPYGLPAEHLNNIKTFLKNGIIPKRIYIGVDSVSYTIDPATHLSDPTTSPYEYSKKNPFRFWWKYLNPVTACASLKTTFSSTKKEDFSKMFYSTGDYWWSLYGVGPIFKMEDAEPRIGYFDNFKGAMENLREIVKICRENNIELVIFTNPMCLVTYEASIKNDVYFSFLEELSKIKDFYNFSGINDITVNEDNFMDNSHYKAEIGDMIIDCLENGIVDETLYSQGFGWYVTKDNIKEFFKVIGKN